MTLREFLPRLRGVRTSGGGTQYTALCPAHDDEHASLSVSEGQDGRILLRCHAGCETAAILAALDLTLSDLFPDPPRERAQGDRRVVETYDYIDADGHLVAQKLRYEPKSFSWRRPDGSGGWIYNRKGVEIPLYRREGLKSTSVFLVEGEKDCDTLTRLGLPAVCSPDGAGTGSKWRDAYTESLRGLHVAVIPDNDTVGADFARMVCGKLDGVAGSVRLLDLTALWPELPEHGDVSDYIAHIRDDRRAADALMQLAKDTPLFTPAANEPAQGGVLALFKPVAEFEESEVAWLVLGWIPAGQITLLASDGGVGKTSVCCALAAAVSSGATCLLDPPMMKREPRSVMILTSEDSISKKLKKKLRLQGADLKNIIAPDPADDPDGLLRDLKFGSPLLGEIIRKYRPALCIIDPVQGYVPPDVNMGSRNAMRDCMATLAALGEETGCAFLVVCHSNKRRGASGRERISDSSDLWDIARSVIMAGFTSEDGVRYLSNEKNNYDRLQETVLFRITDRGLPEHAGFSPKRDRDFVQESYFAERKPEPVNEKLLDALRSEVNPFEPVKFSYRSFEEKYGALIWGGKQPKRALDLVKPILEQEGISLLTKSVKIDGRSANGFLLQMAAEPVQMSNIEQADAS